MKILSIKHSVKAIYQMFLLLKKQKAGLFLTIVSVGIDFAITMATIIWPKYILDALIEGKSIRKIILFILLMSATLLLLKWIQDILQRMLSFRTDIFSQKMSAEISEITGKLSFEKIEENETKNYVFLAQDSKACAACLGIFRKLLSDIITIIGILAIMCTFDMRMMLVVLFTLALKLLSKYKEMGAWKRCRNETASLSREGIYVSNCGLDSRGGKEVRLHWLADWLKDKSTRINEQACSIFSKEFRFVLIFQLLAALVYSLQMVYCYFALTRNVVLGVITVGSYTMYLNAILTFISGLSSITEQGAELKKHMVYIEDLQKLHMDFKEQSEYEVMETQLEDQKIQILFEHVWFRYPNTNTDILKDVCFQINPGAKIALVGKNGAGKSTIIKLLCRFYKPTKGRITLNGVDIERIPYRQYMKYLGIVFQDYQTYAFRIQENITMGRYCDAKKIETVLKQVDLMDDIQEFPQGIESQLSRMFDEKGVELSGGQTQRLILARCLYKDAQIFILDEPTASLDPVAEYEFYCRFSDMVGDSSVIFVSHRLSGAKFCNQIIVLEQGTIVQHGTHDNLMAKDGVYRDLFLRQSEGYLK